MEPSQNPGTTFSSRETDFVSKNQKLFSTCTMSNICEGLAEHVNIRENLLFINQRIQ